MSKTMLLGALFLLLLLVHTEKTLTFVVQLGNCF